MKIEGLRIDGFGKLVDWDSGPLGKLVVVFGPNEAGKSTVFRFLTTALYGFQPASRELSPHVPWGSDEAGGEVRLRLVDGSCAMIARKLRSSPSARLTIGGATRELRNQPLPWVEHIPRTVFRQVFAVTLAELAGLDEDTWARIQDRVLGSMGATDLLPARSVADVLEREAGEIWRPNKRGNQRLRMLQDEMRALRGRRQTALERDREVRALVEDREDVRHKLREIREERERDELVLERALELLPIKRQLDRIAALRAEGGAKSELVGLPADVAAALDAIGEEIERHRRGLETLDAERAEAAVAVDRFGEEARSLVGERRRILAFVTRASDAATDREELDAVRVELRELDVQLRTAAGQLVDTDGVDGHLDEVTAGIRRVSVDLLRDRIARIERAHRDSDAVKETGPGTAVPAGRRSPVALGGTVLIGAALSVWGFGGGPGIAGTAGAVLTAVALTLFVLARSRPGPPSRVVAGPDTGERESLEREVADLVGAIPIRSEYLEPVGPALVSAIGRMQGMLTQRDEARLSCAGIEERLRRIDQEATELAYALFEEEAEGAAAFAPYIEDRLRAAERDGNAAEAGLAELERLERSRVRLEREIEVIEKRESRMRERVAGLTGSGQGNGIATIQARIEAHARADRLADELEHAQPDLAQLRSRIMEAETARATWLVDDADLALRRARLQEVRETIEKLVARAEGLEHQIARLRTEETVDAVDGEIASLQEAERRLIEERDHKWLVAQLVREADRRFREEHQPDLLRRASGYLAELTEGRYDRLLVDELSDGDLFQLVGPGLPKPIQLARPISTGTLEQAYLSLRLAIVDHLDDGEERLPLFVDEALVNWDARRRLRGLELLAEISEARQVFAFTCHPDVAEQLEAHGACVLRLDR